MSTIFINTRDKYPSVIALTNDLTSNQWPICSKLLSEYKQIGESKMPIDEKIDKLQKLMAELIGDEHDLKEW